MSHKTTPELASRAAGCSPAALTREGATHCPSGSLAGGLRVPRSEGRFFWMLRVCRGSRWPMGAATLGEVGFTMPRRVEGNQEGPRVHPIRGRGSRRGGWGSAG